jgi:hypothetical protein
MLSPPKHLETESEEKAESEVRYHPVPPAAVPAHPTQSTHRHRRFLLAQDCGTRPPLPQGDAPGSGRCVGGGVELTPPSPSCPRALRRAQ